MSALSKFSEADPISSRSQEIAQLRRDHARDMRRLELYIYQMEYDVGLRLKHLGSEAVAPRACAPSVTRAIAFKPKGRQKIAFRSDGMPRAWLRRLLFHSNGKVRKPLRRVVFRKNGLVRLQYQTWMSTQGV